MSVEHFAFQSRSMSEEFLDLATLGPSRDISQSDPKVTDLVRDSVAPVLPPSSELSVCERGRSSVWSEPDDNHSRMCRDVACQTDFECPMCIHTLNRLGIEVESRSTQTAPETLSVFTRSSRFLPSHRGCSESLPPPDDPLTLARVSSRGDSTAVLSSRRVRGRFRGRGRGRGRGVVPVNATNQNNAALEQNQMNGVRGRQDRRAAGFNTLLALLESRLGEAAGRTAQDPPPRSGRTPSSRASSTTAPPNERQPSLGQLNASADVAIQVVAHDGDSSSSSDTLFAILAPKNQASTFRTPSVRLPSTKAKTPAITSGGPKSTSHNIHQNSPLANNEVISNLNDRSVTNVNTVTSPPYLSPPPKSSTLKQATVSEQLKRDVPIKVASTLPIPTIADWMTRINRPPTRSRRGGVRAFLGRLLGKESISTIRQQSQTRTNSSATLPNVSISKSVAASIISVKNPVLIASSGRVIGSDSDSTH